MNTPHRWQLTSVLVAMLIVGVGCDIQTQVTTNTANSSLTAHNLLQPTAPLGGNWEAVTPGIERLEYRFATNTYSTLTLYKIDPAVYQLRIVNDVNDPKRVDQWLSTLPKAQLVINGFFFNENFKPTGFLKTADDTINLTHLNTWPGILDLSNTPQIISNKTVSLTGDDITSGGDGFPLLLDHGAIAIDDSDPAANRRSFIATDTAGKVYLGNVPSATVTFYELATIIKNIPDVDWDMALNLDGGSSTGLSSNIPGHEEHLYSYAQVPSVIVVEKK